MWKWVTQTVIVEIADFFKCWRFSLNLQYVSKLTILYFFQWIRPSWSWPISRPFWPGGWLRYWYRWWRRSSWNGTTASIICWHDFNPHFRWGFRSLRSYCGYLSVYECEIGSWRRKRCYQQDSRDLLQEEFGCLWDYRIF